MWNPDRQESVEIEAELVWKSERGVSIKIWDGRMEPHPLKPNKQVKVFAYLPVSQIDDGNFDFDWFSEGDRLKIQIPNWLAMKEGLI